MDEGAKQEKRGRSQGYELAPSSGGRRWLLPLNGCTSRIGWRPTADLEGDMAEARAEIRALMAAGMLTSAEARSIIARLEDAR